MSLIDCDEVDQNQEILIQFRKRLSDLITSDHTDVVLLRWLRAKNFNLKEAEENFRACHATRELYGFNRVLDSYTKPEVFQKYEATTFLGFATDGSGVRYVIVDFDIHGFILSASFFETCNYFCNIMENDLKLLREENIKTGRTSDQIIYIFDMLTYSLRQLSHACVIETGLEFFRIFQDYYPEIWKYMIFINVPFIFNRIYSLFKPVLRESMTRKLKIATKENTKELLRIYIDDDVLPAFLGGQRVDSTGDSYCKEFIHQAGIIDEKYYFRNCLHFIDLTDPGVNVTNINARGVFNLPLVIKEKTQIRFEFRTENGSIDFMILFREFDETIEKSCLPGSEEYLNPNDEKSNVQVLGIKFRVQCHIAPCNVSVTTFKEGIHILQFGNTSSWFTSRKLFYRITLLPPENSTS